MKKVIAYIIGEYKKHRYFVRYCVIGASGASLDFVIFYILTSKLMLFYQYANIISISAGITNNFLWNAFLNFQTKDKIIIPKNQSKKKLPVLFIKNIPKSIRYMCRIGKKFHSIIIHRWKFEI